MKPTTTTFLFLLISGSVFSQSIRGQVQNTDGKPLPFVNVMLLNSKDSSLVKGAVSDVSGSYTIDQVKQGNYVVSASMLGYKRGFVPPVTVTDGQTDLKAPLLLLEPEAKQLSEVAVTAKRPFVEQQIDRMVVNVANSIVASGSTALEVLEKAPGVTVDYQNDRLQLRGKDGVIVQINGKQTYYSAQDLIGQLRGMSSDNIDQIELITNPSAKYDAAGNSGIINIRLKKNSNLGTNGTLSVAGGTGRYDRERGSLQLNHRTQTLNLFGDYSLNRGGNYWDFLNIRNQQDPTADNPGRRNLVHQTTLLAFRDLGQNAKAGLDFSPTKQTTIGLVWTGLWNDHREVGPADATFRRTEGGPVYLKTHTVKTYNINSLNHVGNLNIQHSFGEKKGQLTADFDMGYFQRAYDNQLLTESTVFSEDPVLPAGGLLLTQPTTIRIRTAKADYSRPLSGSWKLEAGLKTASVKTDNDLRVRLGTLAQGQAGRLPVDPAQSNQFQYTERINAAYASVSGKLNPKLDVQAGLRAEHTHAIGNSITLNQVVERNYLKWFPSLFLSQQLPKGQTLALSYSYRIDRPNYQNLNPARGYVDPFAYSQGNPYLRPQFTHAMEARYSLKNNVFASLGFNRTTDLMFFTIYATEGNKIFVTTENLGLSQGYTLTVGVPLTVMKGWQLQTNWLGFYNRFLYNYEGTTLNITNVAGRLNANNALTLGHGWTAEVNGWVNTPAVNGIWQMDWMGSLDAGIQKAVGSALKLKLSGQDLLHTNRFWSKINANGNTQTGRLQFDTRIVMLNLTYTFGNQQVKGERQRRTASEDEINRTN
ncbi:outer membrane beta-barrel family protein [Nibrella saemangeumensis]|uniref:Outer membrane beta-barrel family protein n=1 Tax=Nibrella saemangeumensis TaxID=1084526 RepID=A0ABP8NG64_9BACT